MDKHTLTTVVITAVITATVTVFVTGFFNITKKMLVSSVLKEKIKKTFSKKVRALIWSIFFFLFSGLWVWIDIRKSGPPTRGEVVGIAVSVVITGFWLMAITFNLARLLASRENKNHFDT